jgi:bifunctional DNA-binding transcriptional regulator/antitoxin component of YhaV-PrlF toxin-antitoxin module
MKKLIRKLNKVSSHSYTVNIPKEIIRKYGWRERQRLRIVDKGRGRIEIRDAR